MAKRHKAPTIKPDRGPPEREQHGDLIVDIETKVAGVTARRVMTQTTLDRYYAREEIDRRQHEAGSRLYKLWYQAGGPQAVTSNLFAVPGRDEGAEARRASRRLDFNEAIQRVGLRLSPILVHVCLTDGTASAWARKHGHNPRSGIVVLKLALDALGDHFGLPVTLSPDAKTAC